MTFPRTAKAALAAALLFSPTLATFETQAAPITYVGSGTISSAANINSNGTAFSGFLNPGDSYSFQFTVDPDLPSSLTSGTSTLGSYSARYWNSGTSASLTINGETFTIGENLSGGSNLANTFEYDYGLEQLRYDAREDTDQYSTPGSATSTMAGVDRIKLTFMVTDDAGTNGNEVLDFGNPQFPIETNLGDWDRTFMALDLYSFGSSTSWVQLWDNVNPLTSFNVSNGEGVPAPGALALLGFGLIGLGLKRRRKA